MENDPIFILIPEKSAEIISEYNKVLRKSYNKNICVLPSNFVIVGKGYHIRRYSLIPDLIIAILVKIYLKLLKEKPKSKVSKFHLDTNPHIGSNFDDFLKEEGINLTDIAIKTKEGTFHDFPKR